MAQVLARARVSTVPAIFIDGEAGTTGLGIRERLSSLPSIRLISIAPEQRKDMQARKAMMAEADLVVLCLPDDAAREAAGLADSLGNEAPRILDASSAQRTAEGWTYGFPEMADGQVEAIRAARRVSNPGCYATGAIALLRPLVDAGLVPPGQPLTINAVSGFSGGGRAMIEAYGRGEAPAFELYALELEHKHVPEIVCYAGLERRPIFVPSVGNFRQGMLVSIPLHLDALPGKPAAADLHAALARHYAQAEYISVVDAGTGRLGAEDLNGTDTLELCVHRSAKHPHAVLVARLDNLGKGASGAAVRNIRLMLGL